MTEMDDFGDVGAIQQTGEGAIYWDVSLADVLAELESINVQTAHIQNATLSADRPRRFAGGTPVFIEQFEYGSILWYGDSSGSGGSAGRSDNSYMSKGYSYELRSATDSTHRASMRMKLGAIPEGPVGLQLAFTFATYSDYYEVEFHLRGPDHRYDAEVKIDYNNKVLQILDGVTGWETIFEWDSMGSGSTFFVFLKFTLDTSTGMWDRLYFNSEEEDISAHSLLAGTAEDNGSVWVRVDHYGEDGKDPTVYVDDICITEEE